MSPIPMGWSVWLGQSPPFPGGGGGALSEFLPGTMTLLLGEPGSGKSTLLRMIAGRLLKDEQWTSGGVSINGVPIDSKKNDPAQWVALGRAAPTPGGGAFRFRLPRS